MGKKRITTIGEEVSKSGKSKKEDQSRKLVKSGKQQGRLTDMGQVALAEAEKIKKKEKKLEKAALQAAKKKEKSKETQKPKAGKKAKKKGQRYLNAKKKVDATKKYSINQALKLVKDTSISRFASQVELHLVVKEKGLKRTLELPYPPSARSTRSGQARKKKEKKITLATEKKFPLVHLVLGQLKTKETKLAANFEAIIASIGKNNIKKAVICSTMGPGIKVKIN